MTDRGERLCHSSHPESMANFSSMTSSHLVWGRNTLWMRYHIILGHGKHTHIHTQGQLGKQSTYLYFLKKIIWEVAENWWSQRKHTEKERTKHYCATHKYISYFKMQYCKCTCRQGLSGDVRCANAVMYSQWLINKSPNLAGNCGFAWVTSAVRLFSCKQTAKV